MSKQKKDEPNYIGGQAVMEGVMMRGKTMYALSVRNEKNEIETVKRQFAPLKGFKAWPVIRGVYGFVNSLTLGMKLIYESADMSGLAEEEEPSKLDFWLEKKFGDKLFKYIMVLAGVIAVVFSVVVFMLLPAFAVGLFSENLPAWSVSVFEGIIRICLFLAYMFLISRTKSIKRVFMYHGAEHKTINCYENGGELTPENVSNYSRLHKRCGTSFMLIVMIVAMLVFAVIQTKVVWMRFALRVVFIPLIAGLSYEVIRFAGRHDNPFVRVVSKPGMLLQKLTTIEPDKGQMEVAIAAMNAVLEEEVYGKNCGQANLSQSEPDGQGTAPLGEGKAESGGDRVISD